jgi:hypothetical protein
MSVTAFNNDASATQPCVKNEKMVCSNIEFREFVNFCLEFPYDVNFNNKESICKNILQVCSTKALTAFSQLCWFAESGEFDEILDFFYDQESIWYYPRFSLAIRVIGYFMDNYVKRDSLMIDMVGKLVQCLAMKPNLLYCLVCKVSKTELETTLVSDLDWYVHYQINHIFRWELDRLDRDNHGKQLNEMPLLMAVIKAIAEMVMVDSANLFDFIKDRINASQIDLETESVGYVPLEYREMTLEKAKEKQDLYFKALQKSAILGYESGMEVSIPLVKKNLMLQESKRVLVSRSSLECLDDYDYENSLPNNLDNPVIEGYWGGCNYQEFLTKLTEVRSLENKVVKSSSEEIKPEQITDEEEYQTFGGHESSKQRIKIDPLTEDEMYETFGGYEAGFRVVPLFDEQDLKTIDKSECGYESFYSAFVVKAKKRVKQNLRNLVLSDIINKIAPDSEIEQDAFMLLFEGCINNPHIENQEKLNVKLALDRICSLYVCPENIKDLLPRVLALPKSNMWILKLLFKLGIKVSSDIIESQKQQNRSDAFINLLLTNAEKQDDVKIVRLEEAPISNTFVTSEQLCAVWFTTVLNQVERKEKILFLERNCVVPSRYIVELKSFDKKTLEMIDRKFGRKAKQQVSDEDFDFDESVSQTKSQDRTEICYTDGFVIVFKQGFEVVRIYPNSKDFKKECSALYHSLSTDRKNEKEETKEESKEESKSDVKKESFTKYNYSERVKSKDELSVKTEAKVSLKVRWEQGSFSCDLVKGHSSCKEVNGQIVLDICL